MSKGYIRGGDRQPLLSKDESEYLPRQIQNVKSARVYVFGNDQVEEDEEYELEMSDIRSRRGGNQNRPTSSDEPVFLDLELGDGDTLQKIALKYSCPVAELKRINNLIRDQDFFALRTMKVPIKRYGFLTEIMEEEKRNANARKKFSSKINGTTSCDHEENVSLLDDPDSGHDLSDPETQLKVIRTLSIRDNISSQSREAELFLKNMDRDLSRMKNSRTDRNSLDEVISVLTNKSFHPLEKRKVQLYNGVDCGLNFRKVLAIVIVCCILLPVLIIFGYEYYQSHHS